MSTARVVLAAGLVLLAQLLDVVVLSRWQLPVATPDLTLLVVVALAVLGGPRAGAVAGLSAGLLADLTPPGTAPLGLTAVAYGLAGALAGRWHRPGERSLVIPVVAAAGAAVVALAVQCLPDLLTGGRGLGRTLATIGVGTAYEAVGALVVVPVVVLLDRWVEGDQPEVVRL
jgi:rod shape-determining protein MreD